MLAPLPVTHREAVRGLHDQPGIVDLLRLVDGDGVEGDRVIEPAEVPLDGGETFLAPRLVPVGADLAGALDHGVERVAGGVQLAQHVLDVRHVVHRGDLRLRVRELAPGALGLRVLDHRGRELATHVERGAEAVPALGGAVVVLQTVERQRRGLEPHLRGLELAGPRDRDALLEVDLGEHGVILGQRLQGGLSGAAVRVDGVPDAPEVAERDAAVEVDAHALLGIERLRLHAVEAREAVLALTELRGEPGAGERERRLLREDLLGEAVDPPGEGLPLTALVQLLARVVELADHLAPVAGGDREVHGRGEQPASSADRGGLPA